MSSYIEGLPSGSVLADRPLSTALAATQTSLGDANPQRAVPASRPAFLLPDRSGRAAILFADGFGRDPLKYTWMTAESRPAPRVVREKPISYVKAAIIFGGLAVLLALEVWGAVALGKWVVG